MSEELSEKSSEDTKNDSFLGKIVERLSSIFSKDVEKSKELDNQVESPTRTQVSRDASELGSQPKEPVKMSRQTHPIVNPTVVEKPTGQSSTKMHALYNKYTHLVQERNDILSQKDELTRKVDCGEITTVQTHNKMVALTREAAQLTEVIREISNRLAELGHPRFK